MQRLVFMLVLLCAPIVRAGDGTMPGERVRAASQGRRQFVPTVFANLGTPVNGTAVYCSDCTIANPCAGGGTGAVAKRLNGVWVCN